MRYTFHFDPAPLENIHDLLSLLDISREQLSKITHAPDRFYRKFTIKKRLGGDRLINSPTPLLDDIQKIIYNNILKSIQCSQYAHGFVEEKSIITHAKNHISGKDYLLVDLKDFFPGISLSRVIGVFSAIGYNHELSTILALLTTLNNGLPQGSTTSPYLSNICAIGLDERLAILSSEKDITYSRYADDLAFSGNYIDLAFSEAVKFCVEQDGFTCNENKTLLANNKGKIIVTGISLSRGELHLPRETKRAIRRDAHFLLRNGIRHESRRSGRFDPLYIDRLLGKLAFWLLVEPDNPFPREAALEIKRLGKATSVL